MPQAGRVSELLMRAVRCAAKQYMLQAELGNLAVTDELTGLSNRRGFMALAERQLKLGRRTDRGILLFMIDVDRLKQINDSFGHLEVSPPAVPSDCSMRLNLQLISKSNASLERKLPS
jgi:PleD family two-component response regulator